MILGNQRIQSELDRTKIIINPFNKEQLQACSYDLRLDQFFAQAFNQDRYQTSKNKSLVLMPKERILASTIEQAGSSSHHLNSSIASKSSWARHGMEVCSCAGWGDPGYVNHWTLEIFNKNLFPVKLEYGMLIAQIVFYDVTGCDKKYISKYNNEGVQKICYTDEERFEMMLPKEIKIIL